MKIGNIDITKAYLGSLELKSNNAYLYEYPLINGGLSLEKTPFYFEIGANGYTEFTLSLNNASSNTYLPDLEISTDLVNWTEWTKSSSRGVHVPADKKLYIRNMNNNGYFTKYFSSSVNYYNRFNANTPVKVGGNLLSLSYHDFSENNIAYKSVPQYNFCYMLSQLGSKLRDASLLLLSGMNLGYYCYAFMFEGCSGLTTAPELPATTLAEECYMQMFYNCSGLTTAPTMLPATTLATFCYAGMFWNCTSLTTAPKLPATTLVEKCYMMMFYNCSKLNYINAQFTTTPGSTYTNNWLSDVSSTGTFVKNPDATWNVTGTSGVPDGWTLITSAS